MKPLLSFLFLFSKNLLITLKKHNEILFPIYALKQLYKKLKVTVAQSIEYLFSMLLVYLQQSVKLSIKKE